MPISLIPYKRKRNAGIEVLGGIKSYVINFLPALIVLTVAISGYFVAVSVYKNRLQELDSVIAEREAVEKATIKNKDVDELKNFVNRANALQGILNNHARPSRLLGPFQDSMHDDIALTSFELSIAERTLIVRGFADNFEALGEQFLIWKDESNFVSNVALDSFSKNTKGTVDFSMTLKIVGDFLK